jgi:hypothetical protein
MRRGAVGPLTPHLLSIQTNPVQTRIPLSSQHSVVRYYVAVIGQFRLLINKTDRVVPVRLVIC